uniref:thiamine pyrophosphate-dependent enzyme n=1 Tax=uncultured Thermus sp. TaxID=157149 RepID=UPI00260DF703
MKPKVIRYLDKGEFPIGEGEALALYRAMRRARFFDEKALLLQRQGRLGVYAPFMGQEAAQVGVALALGEKDFVVPSYRESAMLLARGLPIHTLLLYWRAHPAGWRFPQGVRAVNPYIPIATQIPQAVGLALAGRYRGEDWVVATSIGDGGTSEGDFHEGLNFAAVFGAPVVFLVQNNGYAISVPRSRQMRVDYIARRAE